MMAEKIKQWYLQKLWTADMVKDAMDAKVITEDEYNDILGISK